MPTVARRQAKKIRSNYKQDMRLTQELAQTIGPHMGKYSLTKKNAQ